MKSPSEGGATAALDVSPIRCRSNSLGDGRVLGTALRTADRVGGSRYGIIFPIFNIPYCGSGGGSADYDYVMLTEAAERLRERRAAPPRLEEEDEEEEEEEEEERKASLDLVSQGINRPIHRRPSRRDPDANFKREASSLPIPRGLR
ncbi:hypothetical protein JHW43_005585 [Diplocarpon mali]|nr:hypothetical protein JHW43_005585 [Diplocarpon mali]